MFADFTAPLTSLGDHCWKDIFSNGLLHGLDRAPQNLVIQDRDQSTAVHVCAANDVSDLMEGFFSFPHADWVRHLKHPDREGDTPMHKAMQQKSLNWLLAVLKTSSMSDAAKLDLLVTPNNANVTPLSIAVEERELLKLLMESFRFDSYEDLFKAGSDNEDKQNPIHIAVRKNFPQVSELLRALQASDKKEVLKMQDLNGKTVMHLAVEENTNNSSAMIRDLLSSLSDEQGDQRLKFEVLKVYDNRRQTVLHTIADPQGGIIPLPVLKTCLEEIVRFTRDQVRALFNLRDNHQKTALHYAASNIDSKISHLNNQMLKRYNDQNAEALDELVGCLSQVDPRLLLEVIEETDGKQHTALHHAVGSCLKAVETIIEPLRSSDSVSIEEIMQLVSRGNGNGDTVFHVAAQQADMHIFKYLCSLLTTGSKAAILQLTNLKGETVLHKCRGKEEMISVIETVLGSGITAEEQARLISVKDEAGNTVLHTLAMPIVKEEQEFTCHRHCATAVRILLETLQNPQNSQMTASHVLSSIRNQLNGSALEYMIDIEHLCPSMMEEVVDRLSLPTLLEILDITDLELETVQSLNAHQRYALTRILPHDRHNAHADLIQRIRECDATHTQHLIDVMNSTRNADGKVKPIVLIVFYDTVTLVLEWLY